VKGTGRQCNDLSLSEEKKVSMRRSCTGVTSLLDEGGNNFGVAMTLIHSCIRPHKVIVLVSLNVPNKDTLAFGKHNYRQEQKMSKARTKVSEE
jgi:hypothetical protein